MATADAVGDVWAVWLARLGRSLLFLLRSLRAELCALRGGGSLALLLFFLHSHKEQLKCGFRRFICAAFAGGHYCSDRLHYVLSTRHAAATFCACTKQEAKDWLAECRKSSSVTASPPFVTSEELGHSAALEGPASSSTGSSPEKSPSASGFQLVDRDPN